MSFAADPTEACIGVADNGGERLAYFVGDGRRQFSQRCDARNMRKLGLSRSQLLFRLICTNSCVDVSAGTTVA
ncbi:hypothetical protein CI1B_30730 [Bradyrhizobium ivorense]|uniref:Uncharacterized protein n=1 Tax=Bradyrhizobium ivorense TaxID=2511166 RepID=A0A508T671_9BRAD|nr:hypothetical protein CI41S_22010 [Bradyrhizobium ivorense]VIO70419.1 hypothetical protein CI1B_30730 [Bradyrhizobium ivorense]